MGDELVTPLKAPCDPGLPARAHRSAVRYLVAGLLAVAPIGITACTSTALPSIGPTVAPATTDRADRMTGADSKESADPTPVLDPSAAPEPSEFALPTPLCPAPHDAVAVPRVIASIGDGPSIVATRGSSGFTTCSTTASEDHVPVRPAAGLTAHPGDMIRLALPIGWDVLRWDGSDGPAVGDAANLWLPVDVVGRPHVIEVPVPVRPGISFATYGLWLASSDGRAVGQLAVELRIAIVEP